VIPGELPVHVTVRAGKPAEVVRAVAEEVDAGLLVVGTEGLSGPGRLVLGSVAEDLVRTAPRPVLVARDGVAAPDGRAPDRDGVGAEPEGSPEYVAA
jgi:nucleotide-binding universal stress UspA family protein